jgi:multiple sugar transport system permease protein
MLPYMLGGVATVLVWSWLFNPRFGLINRGLYLAFETLDPLVRVFSPTGTDGWTAPDWFYSPAACKPALIIMHVWLCGGAMLVFLAALQRVPGTLHDAARIDGAGAVRRFFAITLPHISPAIVFNAAVGVIFSMQAFDQAYLLYNRAQRDGLLFYMLRLYRVAFEDPHRLGYASALAWILFVVIAALTAPLVAIAGKRVYYAADR